MYEGLKLASTVHLRDDAGKQHVFYRGDEPPAWAREKISNPKAWGFNVLEKHFPAPHVDYGSEPEDLLDVMCCPQPDSMSGEPEKLIARFERLWDGVMYLPDGSTEPRDYEWRWTASFAMHRDWHSAGSQDGLATVDDDRQVVYLDPQGRRKVRLYCRNCLLDITLTWPVAVGRFEKLHDAKVSSVTLPALVATITA